MGWEDDPELGFGKPTVKVDPPVVASPEPKRPRVVIHSPVLATAQSLGKIGSMKGKGKPAYVDLPCFTC